MSAATMNGYDPLYSPPTLASRVDRFVARGIHLTKRAAVAFALAVLAAIGLGAAATDNGFVQLIVTFFAAVALWVPILVAILWGERALGRRSQRRAARVVEPMASGGAGDAHWQRLARLAPEQRERIHGLQQSVARSHRRLGSAGLDPEAHDLCILIDRRLPELIDRELDALPPDDRGRKARIDGLINLVDQFARHCSRHGSGDAAADEREAEILRRRFQERLAPPPFDGI